MGPLSKVRDAPLARRKVGCRKYDAKSSHSTSKRPFERNERAVIIRAIPIVAKGF